MYHNFCIGKHYIWFYFNSIPIRVFTTFTSFYNVKCKNVWFFDKKNFKSRKSGNIIITENDCSWPKYLKNNFVSHNCSDFGFGVSVDTWYHSLLSFVPLKGSHNSHNHPFEFVGPRPHLSHRYRYHTSKRAPIGSDSLIICLLRTSLFSSSPFFHWKILCTLMITVRITLLYT